MSRRRDYSAHPPVDPSQRPSTSAATSRPLFAQVDSSRRTVTVRRISRPGDIPVVQVSSGSPPGSPRPLIPPASQRQSRQLDRRPPHWPSTQAYPPPALMSIVVPQPEDPPAPEPARFVDLEPSTGPRQFHEAEDTSATTRNSKRKRQRHRRQARKHSSRQANASPTPHDQSSPSASGSSLQPPAIRTPPTERPRGDVFGAQMRPGSSSPGPSSQPSVPPLPPGHSGISIRRTEAKKRLKDHRERFPPPAVGTSQSTLRSRAGEVDLRQVVQIAHDLKAIDPEPGQPAPDVIDLSSQIARTDPWRVLREDRQDTDVIYYDMMRPVTEASATVERRFVSLDVYLVFLFARIHRFDWVQLDAPTRFAAASPEAQPWARAYKAKIARWEQVTGMTVDQRAKYHLEREYTIAYPLQDMWKELIFPAACHYVLRRAAVEPAFREALLKLPSSGTTTLLAATNVTETRYASVLREVKSKMITGFTRPLGGLPADLWIGDSHLAPMNYRSVNNQPIPGYVGLFRVLGFSGADVRSVAWITQAITGPGTRWVGWCVGTNNVDLVPPPSKDDRTAEERRQAPQPQDPYAPRVQMHFTRVALEVAYFARLVQLTMPTLSGLLLLELPPRYDFLGRHRVYKTLFGLANEGDANRAIRLCNKALTRLVAGETRLHVLPLFERLNDPDYFYRPYPLGYGMHPNKIEMFRQLSYLVETIQAHGLRTVEAVIRLSDPDDDDE